MSGQDAYSQVETSRDTWGHGPDCDSLKKTVSDTYSHVGAGPDTSSHEVYGPAPQQRREK